MLPPPSFDAERRAHGALQFFVDLAAAAALPVGLEVDVKIAAGEGGRVP